MKHLSILLCLFHGIFCLGQTTTRLNADGMIDVTSGKLLNDVIITLENDRITQIETGKSIPEDNFVDLSGYTLLPGLIDCHTHLTVNSYIDYPEFDYYGVPAPMFGIFGAVNAEKTVQAGFTTVRDVHGEYYADLALRDAINKGWVKGPRMFVTGPGLSITGGHGAWGNWLSPAIQFKKIQGVWSMAKWKS